MEGTLLTTEEGRNGATVRSTVGSLWRMLTSARFAVLLMILLTVAAILGAIIPQIPSELVGGEADYQWWMETVARAKFGPYTDFMEVVDLFDVFHSTWFLAIGALLMTSIVACSVRRWPTMRALLRGGRVRHGNEFYTSGKHATALSSAHPEPVGVTADILRAHGYRVRSHFGKEPQRTAWIAADKNRYFRLGTYMIHLSLILLVAGYLMGSYLGFRDTDFIVAEGTVREVGHNTGLSVGLLRFSDEYWSDGTPKDYRSEVVVYKDGQEVKRGTIRVNSPLSCGGVQFYQSFFGPAAEIEVKDGSGELLYHGVVPLSGVAEAEPFQRPVGMFKLTEQGVAVYMVGSAFGTIDPYIGSQQVGLEIYESESYLPLGWTRLDEQVAQTVSDLQFTLVSNANYTGLQVKRDPGVSLIWAAAAFFVLGLVGVFLFPHRQLWAMIEETTGGRGQVRLRSKEGRGPFGLSEYNAIADELRRKLKENPRRLSDEHGEGEDG